MAHPRLAATYVPVRCRVKSGPGVGLDFTVSSLVLGTRGLRGACSFAPLIAALRKIIRVLPVSIATERPDFRCGAAVMRWPLRLIR